VHGVLGLDLHGDYAVLCLFLPAADTVGIWYPAASPTDEQRFSPWSGRAASFEVRRTASSIYSRAVFKALELGDSEGFHPCEFFFLFLFISQTLA
jgi:hypothetical protein